MKKLVLLFMFFSAFALAQIQPAAVLYPRASRPSGSCSVTFGYYVYTDNPVTIWGCNGGTWGQINGGGGGGGGVSSVGLYIPPTLCSISGSPVTTSGTLTCNYATGQTPNLIFGTDGSGNVGLMNLTSAQVPTLNQNTTGNAATATALASTPTLCSSGQAPIGVLPSGNATGCVSVANPLPAYGSIVNQQAWPTLTGWNTNGTTPTIDGSNRLVFSSGSTSFTQSLDWIYDTALDTYTIDMIYQTNTLGSGLGIGTRSTSTPDQIAAFVNTSTGTLTINGSGTVLVQSAAVLSFSANDIVECWLTRKQNYFTFSARNRTTGAAMLSISWNYRMSLTDPQLPNHSRFAVYNLSGTQTVQSFSVSSDAPVGAAIAFVGDSKTQGFYSQAASGNFPAILGTKYVSLNLGSGSDTTSAVLTRLPEIIALKPKNVLLEIGCNDIRNSVPTATWQANYASIVSQLQAAGIPVYHLILVESSISLTALNSWISSTYGAAVIDPVGSTFNSTLTQILAADGIHPNPLYHSLIANAIDTYFSALNTPVNYAPLNVIQNATTMAPWYTFYAQNYGVYGTAGTLTNFLDINNPAAVASVRITPSNLNLPALQAATLDMQEVSLNNSFVGENTYYNGSNQIYQATGYADYIKFTTGEIALVTAPSGTAGATIISSKVALRTSQTGQAGLGGSITTSTFAGSSLYADASGNVAVGRTSSLPSLFSVGSTSGFQADGSGDVIISGSFTQGSTGQTVFNASGTPTKLNSATVASFPSSNAAGALTNDGSGNFSYVSSASANQHQEYWNIQSALFATSTVLSSIYYEGNTATIKAVDARLTGTISCTVAPTIAILDLGTSATTAYGSATVLTSLATGTSDGAYESTVPLSVAITAGHRIGMGFSAGTCITAPTMDITVAVQ